MVWLFQICILPDKRLILIYTTIVIIFIMYFDLLFKTTFTHLHSGFPHPLAPWGGSKWSYELQIMLSKILYPTLPRIKELFPCEDKKFFQTSFCVYYMIYHNKSDNMKVLVILNHSWSPYVPLSCLYGKKWNFVGLCAAFCSIFARKNAPIITTPTYYT